MFKRIVVELRGPICSCLEANFSWQVPEATLILKCKTCGVQLIVPNSEFKAAFKLDKEYPGKPVKIPDEPKILKSLDGGLAKVLPFGDFREDNL